MRKAKVYVNDQLAGVLEELERGSRYRFVYGEAYTGLSVSLTMPCSQQVWEFDRFPPFFEGLLPEGVQLNFLLRGAKLDSDDLFGQLLQIGADTVGNVTIFADEP